jgi:hypothetical protein
MKTGEIAKWHLASKGVANWRSKSNGISGVAKAKANVAWRRAIGRGGQQNGGQNGGSRRKSSGMKNRKGEKPGEKKRNGAASVAAWRSEINYKSVSISAAINENENGVAASQNINQWLAAAKAARQRRRNPVKINQYQVSIMKIWRSVMS